VHADDSPIMDIVANRTLRDQWEELAQHHALDTFLVHEDPEGRVTASTYGEFGARIIRAANLLRGLGVLPGDCVGVHLGNSPQQIECLFALAVIGAVAVPLHPRATAVECARILGRVDARLVVCEPEVRPEEGYPPGIRVLVARDCSTGEDSYCAQRDRQQDTLVDPVALSSDDPAVIVFSSGSTAEPKAVVLTHANLLFSGIFVTWQSAMTGQDRLLTTMPACHVNFVLNALMPVLTVGACLVAVERYSARKFWAQVKDHDATVVQAISTIARTMLLQPPASDDRDHRVREVLYYLPISDEEKVAFVERFGVRLLNSYGTSETLVGVLTDPPVGPRRWPSIGRVGLGYEARIAGPDGQELAAGEHGEIQIKGVPGRTLMAGYHGDPVATAEVYTDDGWFRTGDVGWVDEDGWFFFVDRLSHFIKRAGENVSPGEVEEALTAHPEIAQAAVVGVPDSLHDEAVKAFVVLRPGSCLSVTEIQGWAASRLSDFKVPSLVEVVDALPLTTTFKVAKSALS
ncbi:AMP-binding protein, partial [Actinotalea sp.]|uniref:AMP-binding protein n=1 Tax=Actinotalea sp. TaxID=1872145 RepID=UPI0035636FDE